MHASENPARQQIKNEGRTRQPRVSKGKRGCRWGIPAGSCAPEPGAVPPAAHATSPSPRGGRERHTDGAAG